MNKKQQAQAIAKYVRLADYLSVAQIFLRDNFFLERKLISDDIKKRLLGHWGTCPGINFVYANLNNLIIKHRHDILFTVGVGHGFPAYQSNIFIEKTLTNFFPKKIPYNRKGLEEILENFSTPYGYPSHLNPEAPGTILEGGELGYSLSVAAGTVLDNPKIINAVLIGDGEAETGPLAASWQVNKLLNSKRDGALLPILHLNGYKISGPTVFGRMTDQEVQKYFEALGWEPLFINGYQSDFYIQGIDIFEKAYRMIKRGQQPIIILKTPKGQGAPAKVGNKKVAGNHYAHQVVFDDLKNQKELLQLEKWLKSYKSEELLSFTSSGQLKLNPDLKALIPSISKTIGSNKFGYGSEMMKKIPKPGKIKGTKKDSSMHVAGKYFKELMDLTKASRNFRLFSPDETYSNKLDKVFESTSRAWSAPLKPWDIDMSQGKRNDGRVVELLSEHVLFGMLWGYTLSGRHGVFVSYEAFAQIVSSMADQYVKFLRASQNLSFRKEVPALNVILSSLLERQDHNGFSHQNPSFIASNLDRDRAYTDVYFPADKNIMAATLDTALAVTNKLNIIVAGKKIKREWLKPAEIKELLRNKISIWKFASSPNPDLVVATCGDYVTEEALAGVKLFKERFPKIRLRFVNILKLDVLDEDEPGLSPSQILSRYLTKDKGIVFNFHGYPSTVKKLLFDYDLADRIIINGYEEEGSTTSPFDMKARNGLSRFHLVKDLVELGERQKLFTQKQRTKVFREMNGLLSWEKSYIKKHKVDPEEITHWEF